MKRFAFVFPNALSAETQSNRKETHVFLLPAGRSAAVSSNKIQKKINRNGGNEPAKCQRSAQTPNRQGFLPHGTSSWFFTIGQEFFLQSIRHNPLIHDPSFESIDDEVILCLKPYYK